MKFKNILFPTDFSNDSEKARDYVLYLSEELKATVHILHVIEPLEYSEVDEEIQAFYDDLKTKLSKKMKNEIMHFNNRDIKTKTNLIIGKRWIEINEYAAKNNIDLIIMGSHGIRNKKGELLVGTTSHKVVFTSPCPLLLIRD
ncbi:MAG: universal stress protein [Candidatus Dadabacteria bacterium]|nr:universal stress protein [Candidatus Dadabacteria bacterium]